MKKPVSFHLVVWAAFSSLSFSSCAKPSIKTGQALLVFREDENFPNRIHDARFVSLNREPLAKPQTHLDLPVGKNKVEVSFKLAGGPEVRTMLDFKARSDCQYEVRFDAFPPRHEWAHKGIKDTWSWNLSYLAMLTLPVETTIKAALIGEHHLRDSSKTVQWTYVDVISTDPSQGMVFRVKVP